MAHWSDRYLETAYEEGKYDCGAFAAAVQLEVFGKQVQLPTARRAGPFGRSADVSDGLADYGISTNYPCDGDAVCIKVRNRLQHIGVYCVIDGEPWLAHNSGGFGKVVRFRLRDCERLGYIVEGYYKWK